MKLLPFFVLFCAHLTFCQHQIKSAETYKDSVDGWFEKRYDGLKRPHGWLSLIGLQWLKDGKNEIEGFGIVTLHGDKANLELAQGVNATRSGISFVSGSIILEADTIRPDKIENGSKAFVIIKRGERYAARIWDSQAEARINFKGIERFPVLPQWCIRARWEEYKTPKKVTIATVIEGFNEEYLVPGAAHFEVKGKKYKLEPVIQNPTDDFFFIFGDLTNKKETYPAGRFLYSSPAKDGVVILDFNKAYNPPCAFSPYATCPLPAKENKLNVKIEAGEKRYGTH